MDKPMVSMYYGVKRWWWKKYVAKTGKLADEIQRNVIIILNG